MNSELETQAGLPAEGDPAHAAIVHDPTPVTGQYKRTKALTSAHFTERMDQLIKRFGFKDPILVLLEVANGVQVDIKTDQNGNEVTVVSEFAKKPDHKTRVMAATELASYTYPKRKAVEVSGTEGQPIAFNVVADNTEIPQMPSAEELEAMAKERRRAISEEQKLIDAKAD